MKYSRGRVIALTILSVTVMLALFGAGLIYNFRDLLFNVAADSTTEITDRNDPKYIPGFDDLYERIAFGGADTGTVNLGQNAQMTLVQERYDRGILSGFLNSSSVTPPSFRNLQTTKRIGIRTNQGNVNAYPVFSNNEMQSIVRGTGNSLEIPVVMLDPNRYDDVVLFELTNLEEMPINPVIKRDGVTYQNNVNLHLIDNNYSEDQVYKGIPNYTLTGATYPVYATDGTTKLLTVYFLPDSRVAEGYIVKIKDANGQDFFTVNATTNAVSSLETISDGTVQLCDGQGNWLYSVARAGGSVTIKNPQGTKLCEDIIFNKSEHQILTKYDIGGVAYNSKALRGMFREQGLYEISFQQMIRENGGTYVQKDISFAFVIVNQANYDNFPRFNVNNRVLGYHEVYNYSYESEYPVVTYPKSFFDVKVATNTDYYENDAEMYQQRELKFYNIGEYRMVSTLQYYSSYLVINQLDYSKRGFKNGYITLKRYTSYASVLNILGFQAYYGGQHADPKYNGPLPFYSSSNANISSDISSWVRDMGMTIDKKVSDYRHMRVSDALNYSNDLANFITTNDTIQPVRTNFPPVKIKGNVAHATGAGVNGEKSVILSTVAYRPFYGAENGNGWQTSETLEDGAPFEEAGQYLVTVYFEVGDEICQQTFYFEIVNAINITFEVTANHETKTYYAGELELNKDLRVAGNQVKLSYDGKTSLSEFEVVPTITLAYADFGSYNFVNQDITSENDGSFAFSLRTGQYRLTVRYGAHGKSATVFDIVVDNTQATGIKANTKAKSLVEVNHNLPHNVAIVGAGEVNLTWDNKDSGIDFDNVYYEFYEMVLSDNTAIDPNANKNYQNFPPFDNITNLYSAYSFSQNVVDADYLEPKSINGGWTLTKTFSDAGLYRFNLIDKVGNETPYVLIIDNSTPTFVQNGEKPTADSNIVNLSDNNNGVKVGFGNGKLIKRKSAAAFNGTTYQEVFASLVGAGILVENRDAIKIPLARVEWNISGNLYQDVSSTDLARGYMILNQEGTYYFRVTDVLGNIGEYYIILTYDHCFGMVYAESDPIKISTKEEHDGRGMIETSPNAGTSMVTATGGMTNRPYVYFAFNQQNGATFRVNEVYLQYYPLNYQLTSVDNSNKVNPNYPFAERQSNNPISNGKKVFAGQDNDGLIYSYKDEYDSVGGTIRLALFNDGTTTPSGMYIITRVYNSKTGKDELGRDYYFIVDNQKILYYGDDYQTALSITFGKTKQDTNAKVADAKTIHNQNNVLSSNRTAWLSGFKSKYSWKHDSIEYVIKNGNFNHLAYEFSDNNLNEANHRFNFPALTPHFSYCYNDQIITLGEGKQTTPWAIGDPANHMGNADYELFIMDNARNISCKLIDGNIVELKADDAPTSANWDCITLKIETDFGTKAEIVTGDSFPISNSGMEYDGESYIYVVDPNEINQLKFQFENDPQSMYADLDQTATINSWTWKLNGKSQKLQLQPTQADGLYIFDLLRDVLNNQPAIKSNGSSLSVSLITCDGMRTNYTILFDRFDPSYNLGRVKTGDNLACTLGADELPGDYFYGLSSNFVFESDHTNNPYLDTKVITYREVDYTGDGPKIGIPLELYTGAVGETPIPFATLVGLRDNEMKYYQITEIDYVGHAISYYVQIQGDNYANAISFVGAVSEEGAEIQVGVGMHALSSSVHEFFLRNNAFKFENGEEYFTVIGSIASWKVGDDVGAAVKSEGEEKLIATLDKWIEASTSKGTKCLYKLYDRMGDVEIFEFYNLRETAALLQLDCYQPSATNNNMIQLDVANTSDLPRILFDSNLAPLFKIEVQDITTNEMIQNVHFSLSGTPIYVDVTHEYVIKVTDPFGRTSTTEYHKQTQSTIGFSVYGNTVTRNGVTYVGDERGVKFNYLNTVYSVLIYNYETEELVTGLQTFNSNGMIYYSLPQTKVDVKIYHIVATGRASGAIMFDRVIAFDTSLPTVEWKNDSDQLIEVEGQSFVSSVVFDISNSMVDTLFPVTISYTRTLNNRVEAITVSSDTKKIRFYQEGAYEVTIRNSVWAKKSYKFEIVQVDNTLVYVYDDNQQIQASSSDYKYTINGKETPITRYIFSTTINPDLGSPYVVTEYQKHGLLIKKGQTNRVLAGNPENGTDYYDYDALNDTLIWRLALKANEDNGTGVPDYTSPIYFATTGVGQGHLPEDGTISLQLNGNPNIPTSVGAFTVIPSSTCYNVVYNNFMTEERGKKITVRLYYADTGLKDDNGAPCYSKAGNLILVDCYYNGTLVKTLTYKDVFTINQNDAGYYEFKVHDMVGNYLYFGNSTDEKDINYKQNRYLLAVMTKPIVEINAQQPVNGMIYNDQVELKITEYGDSFLKKYYEMLYRANKVTDEYKIFFNRYFCVTKMEVIYTGPNGTNTSVVNVTDGTSVFRWTQSGKYHVILNYRVFNPDANDAGQISNNLPPADYTFQIISKMTISESFNMSVYPDIPVVSITRDGYQISDPNIYLISGGNDDYMSFDANNNPGKYVVKLKSYNTILQSYLIYEIQFNIQHKSNSASTYFILSSASGSSTVGNVTMYFNPYWLYLAQGDVTITLTKDYQTQQVVKVNSSVLANASSSQELFNVSEAGIYRVAVRDAEGALVYSDSWTIEAEQSTFGYIILAVVLGIAGIGALLFIRMRHKMTTK